MEAAVVREAGATAEIELGSKCSLGSCVASSRCRVRASSHNGCNTGCVPEELMARYVVLDLKIIDIHV